MLCNWGWGFFFLPDVFLPRISLWNSAVTSILPFKFISIRLGQSFRGMAHWILKDLGPCQSDDLFPSLSAKSNFLTRSPGKNGWFNTELLITANGAARPLG